MCVRRLYGCGLLTPETAPGAPTRGTADGIGDGALCVRTLYGSGLPTAPETAPCASAGGTADGIGNGVLCVRTLRLRRLLLAPGTVPCVFAVRTADGLRSGFGLFLVLPVDLVRLLVSSVTERGMRPALPHADGSGRCLPHAFAVRIFQTLRAPSNADVGVLCVGVSATRSTDKDSGCSASIWPSASLPLPNNPIVK